MKYTLIFLTALFFTMPLAMANGGPTTELLKQRAEEREQKIQLIDQANEKTEKEICLTNVAQNKVKVTPC